MTILITPLNWGLGHATRCIPIIQILKKLDCKLILASDGSAGLLLKKEFPDVPYFELPSYEIEYYPNDSFLKTMLRLSPKIYRAIKKENDVIRNFIKNSKIDAIISDNRYGCYHNSIQSILISHQLRILTPFKLLDSVVNRMNRTLIHNFDNVWVPDTRKVNLAGKLSKDSGYDVENIGLLSRMETFHKTKLYDICVVLSGPEPQRTVLETEILDQTAKLRELSIIIVQGKMNTKTTHTQRVFNVTIVSYMTSDELNRTMNSSDLIIARSGYSTLMDLCKLGKKALLIPTPGQTEQEYLAKELAKRKICEIQTQGKLNLNKAYVGKDKYSGFKYSEGAFFIELFLKSWVEKKFPSDDSLSLYQEK